MIQYSVAGFSLIYLSPLILVVLLPRYTLVTTTYISSLSIISVASSTNDNRLWRYISLAVLSARLTQQNERTRPFNFHRGVIVVNQLMVTERVRLWNIPEPLNPDVWLPI